MPIEARVAEWRRIMQGAMDLLEDQVAKGNNAFLERFMDSTQSSGVLMEEVKNRRNKRSMPRTWGRYRHPSANVREIVDLVRSGMRSTSW
jgi:hypothetical protein